MANDTDFTNCPSPLRQIYLSVAGCCGLILNLFLLILIRNRTTSVMKTYKKVLYAGCIVDIYSATLQMLIQERLSYEYGIHVKSIDGPLLIWIYKAGLIKAKNLNFIAMWEGSAIFVTNAYSFVPFLYRYVTVVKNHQPSNREFFACCSFLFTLSLVASFCQGITSALYHDFNVYMIRPMSNNCVPNLPFYDGKLQLEDSVSWYAIFVYVGLHFALVPSYLIIPFCGWRIYSFLKKNSKLSAKMKEMHKQISRTLTIQSIFPLLCVGAPSCVMILYTTLNMNNPDATHKDFFYQVGFDTIALVPIINPLAAIIFINSYRQSILNIFLNVHDQVFKTVSVTHVQPISISQQRVFTM